MRKLFAAWRGRTAGGTRLHSLLGVVAGLVLFAGCRSEAAPIARSGAAAGTAVSSQSVKESPSRETPSVRTRIGFRSRKNLDEHFAKHGREFRGLDKNQYLLAAQTLRDRPVGGDVEEILRNDGSASRFDKESGAFLAFNRDGTIRTFFKPNDGEQYFRRQAQRSH